MEKIFENIGGSIKKVAKALFYIRLFCVPTLTIIAFLYYLANAENIDWIDNPYAYGDLAHLVTLGKNAILAKSIAIYGLIETIVVPLSCLTLYGFGQLVEDTHSKQGTTNQVKETETVINDLPEL